MFNTKHNNGVEAITTNKNAERKTNTRNIVMPQN